MIDTYDFTQFPEEKFLLYGGSHKKFGVNINDEPWMAKFSNVITPPPDTGLTHMRNVVSEYIGSHVYEILEVPVQETILGYYRNRLVVGCKDLRGKDWKNSQIDLFVALKNLYIPELAEFEKRVNIFTRHGFPLEAVQEMFVWNTWMRDTPGLKDRFWDMFVVDALIGNQTRNNEDWGILEHGGNDTACPVFDNGGAFQSMTFDEQTEELLSDDAKMEQEAHDTTSYFTDEQYKHIRPFDYMAKMEDQDCNAAVCRIVPRIDLEKINTVIWEIPEEIGGFPAICGIQREYCSKIMQIRYEKCLLPVYEQLTAG